MGLHRVRRVVHEEINGFRPLLALAIWYTGFVPDLVGNRTRVIALRLAGVRIGFGTVIGGRLTIVGERSAPRNVTVGRNCWINASCYLDASDQIDIGDDVAIGQQALILTQTHDIGPASARAGIGRTAPVRIGNGCWLGARSLILPGITIGDGAIVAAAAVVTRDVAPNTIVAGVPAVPVRDLGP